MKTLLRKRIYMLSLIPISLLLIAVAKNNREFTERIFSLKIYHWISQLLSLIFGLFPFSVTEILVILLPMVLLFYFLRFVFRFVKIKETRKECIIKGFLNLLCIAGVTMFLYTMLAGLNYYRYSFSEYSGLEPKESTVDELYELTRDLTLQANEIRQEIPFTDKEGVFQLAQSNYEVAEEANAAFKKLAKEYPVLGGYYSAPKPVLLSGLMSTTEITGVFFPFTMEANVNVDIPDYKIPATMLHELAHLRGFMREDEANYLAYLAGVESDNEQLQYSSIMLALMIAGNALYEQSPSMYSDIRDLYSEGVLADIRANSAYWQKYDDTVISTMSNKINDTYLKVNAQKDGVKSYGRMLDLLLAQYRRDKKSD